MGLNCGLTQARSCAIQPKGRSLKQRVTAVQIPPVVTFVNPCSTWRGMGKAVSGILPLKSSRVLAVIHASGDSACFNDLQKASSAESLTSCLLVLPVRRELVTPKLGDLGDATANTERGMASVSEAFKPCPAPIISFTRSVEMHREGEHLSLKG